MLRVSILYNWREILNIQKWKIEHNINFLIDKQLILPEPIEHLVLLSYEFDIKIYNEGLFKHFNIHFPETIKNSVIKRQAEYLAGRYTAIRALGQLGVEVNNIGTAKHRSPVWPEGITASITHTDTISVCVAGHKDTFQFLGIDLEKRLSLRSALELKDIVISVSEERILLKSGLTFEDGLTLIFSAKESLFKALYPSVGYYFDFSAAQIISIDCNRNIFNVVLLESLTSKLVAGMKFEGYFSFEENHVFTIIIQ